MKSFKHISLFGFRSIQNKSVYLGIFITCVFVLASYVWFGTAGTWKTWPATTHYYNLLADGFVKGQTFLDIEPPQELLALSNPYSVLERKDVDYLWDASLHKGKYYLYWGPFPSIVIALIKLIHPQEIGDNLIVFTAAVGLFIFQTLLLTRIWMRFFERLPFWTLIIGILLTGLVIPINWMIHRGEIYQAAIMNAQFFLMGGLYFAYRAFDTDEILSTWLAWASVFWACAIASRTTVILPVILLLFYILKRILHTHGIKLISSVIYPLIAAGVPILIGVIWLGWYNYIRFESVFDFGFKYQLTIYNAKEHESDIFSTDFILPNAYYYFINPPTEINTFPYFRAKSIGKPEAFGIYPPKLYYTEKVTGAIYALPFIIFTFVPLTVKISQIIKNKKYDSMEPEKTLSWIVNALSGATIVASIPLFMYVFSIMRFYADVTPMLITLATIGFWVGYREIESSVVGQLVYTCFGIILASISIIAPNLLALHSSERLMEFSPQVFTVFDALIKPFLN